MEKRRVFVYHSTDVKIEKCIGEDHQEWFDANDQLIEKREYLVLKIKKTCAHLLLPFKIPSDIRIFSGYRQIEQNDYIEIQVYDRNTYIPILKILQKFGIIKLQEQYLPNFKTNGELFPMYLDPSNPYQWFMNISRMIIQSPTTIYKAYKRKKEYKTQKT